MLKPVWNMAGIVKMQAEEIKPGFYTLKAEEDSLAVEVNGALLRIGYIRYDLSRLEEFLKETPDLAGYLKSRVLEALPAYSENKGTLNMQWANAVGLSQEAQEARLKREECRRKKEEEKAAQKASQEAKRKEQEAQELEEVEVKFKNGEYIDSLDFENLLIKYNLWNSVHMRTKGWIRKNLTEINKSSYRAYTKGDSVFASLNLLKQILGV